MKDTMSTIRKVLTVRYNNAREVLGGLQFSHQGDHTSGIGTVEISRWLVCKED